jgi:uncharacterized protein
MKYLLVLAVLAVAFWVWRNNRQSAKSDQNKPARNQPARAATAEPQAMLQCAACGVHLPSGEAVTGRQGSYCSAAHLAKREG